VAELLRVDDRAHGLDDAVYDVERDHVDEAALGVEEERARLPVDLGGPAAHAESLHLPAQAEEEPADAVLPVDRARPRGRPPAPVAVDDDVRGEQADEALGVVLLASTCRLARTASWRQLSSLFPTTPATSSYP
jgi:hypothetical protein